MLSSSPHSTTLSDLPPELLDQITSYLSSASSLRSLSLTSRNLNAYITTSGHRTFIHARFPLQAQSLPHPSLPSLPSSPVFKSSNPTTKSKPKRNGTTPRPEAPPLDTAESYTNFYTSASRALTSLSRASTRRSFLASYIQPSGTITSLSSTGEKESMTTWKRPKGQTMGFQPVVDCYETFVANSGAGGYDWARRREVLAWSAGAEVLVRVRRPGEAGRETEWWSYRPEGAMEGRDDVTSVRLLRRQEGSEEGERVVAGTANAKLRLLAMPPREGEGVVTAEFKTQGRSVRSTSVDEGDGLLAANLGDTFLAIYSLSNTKSTSGKGSRRVQPLSHINALPTAKPGCRIWSTKFLSQSTLAIGLGPSVEPIHIFTITPSGLHAEADRTFSLIDDLDSRLDNVGTVRTSSSVYPIEPIPSAVGDTKNATTFLSGGYDGVIRLHDMRSHRPVEGIYKDPTDDSAVYSLLARGRDKIIAGTSRHALLKVFDLRMSGASEYNFLDARKPEDGDNHDIGVADLDHPASTEGDWNVFLNPRGNNAQQGNWARRSAESPIYSLASPSLVSPYVYAGVENALVEFNFSAAADKYPDPLVGQSPEWTNRARDRDVLNFAAYSQGTDSKTAMRLRVQQSVKDTVASAGGRPWGLDERWIDAGSERREVQVPFRGGRRAHRR
ncbi:hypothetical protein MBLNU457_6923t1 [Dothideomycetes sp. NU457]